MQQQARISLVTAKKPGVQTSQKLAIMYDNHPATSIRNAAGFKSNPFSDGFVLDGYFLGTFEFDSLTGHPGIRY
ncbi:hypothetical protein [Rufibacter tibetensis]|nr:hypothetical protein [Rufibacter tibetensis]